MKLGFVRVDKIGDLVVTLPVDQIFPSNQVTWIINKGLGPVCEMAEPKRSFFELKKASAFKNFLSLYFFLRKSQFDALVIFYAPWWVAMCAFFARTPIRIGRKSQWWSYLFLNQGLRQKRSLSEKHELEYNFELAQMLPYDKSPLAFEPLKLNPPPARQLFEKYALTPQKYVVVHPGMKGSALNWSLQNYQRLIGELSKSQQVVITGTQADRAWTEPLQQAFMNVKNIIFLTEKLNMKELLYVLKFATCVVAPSTGVAHLSASVGTKTVGLYPDLQKQSPSRWRPLGAQVLLLTSDQPQLNEISVDQVIKACL